MGCSTSKCGRRDGRIESWYTLIRGGILSPTIFRVFKAGGRKSLGWGESKKRLHRDNAAYERAVRVKREELGLDVDTGKPVEGKKDL